MFRSRYSVRKPSTGLVCSDLSRTRLSDFQSTKIDTYMNAYLQTGVLGDPARVRAMHFEDLRGVDEFDKAMMLASHYNEQFMQLPSSLRARFGNIPKNYVHFLLNSTPEQRKEVGIILEGVDDVPLQVDPAKSTGQLAPSPASTPSIETPAGS